MPQGRYLTAAEIARELGLSAETVRKWLRTGYLPAVRVGGVLCVPESLYIEWRKKYIESGRKPAGEAR